MTALVHCVILSRIDAGEMLPSSGLMSANTGTACCIEDNQAGGHERLWREDHFVARPHPGDHGRRLSTKCHCYSHRADQA